MRVALVHDWLNGMRGGEKVLQEIAGIFPESRIYTLFSDPEHISAELKRHEIKTSFIQHLPLRRKYYRHYLPLFPMAIERFDFSNFDLVVSSSHCVAKSARTGKNTLHVCYCYSPMRYIWDRFDDYFPKDSINPLRYRFIKYICRRLRRWDVATSRRADLFIADSEYVAARIKNYYGRASAVIYPPVDTDFFTPTQRPTEDYYLVVSALVPYKRVDLAVKAFANLKRKLVVVGDGPMLGELASMAGRNVSFTGWIDNDELREYYRNCRALIFPGVEDFGIVPVEAQACGRPVIAYADGGALETVIGQSETAAFPEAPSATGVFFKSQEPEELLGAIERFEKMTFDCLRIRNNALRFARATFLEKFKGFLTDAVGIFRSEGKFELEARLLR